MKAFGDSISSVGSSMSKWVTGPIAAVGTGIIALATDIGNTADRILDLSAITGQSTTSIQAWQNAAKIAGTELEAVSNVSRKLTEQIGEIEKGEGRAADAFKQLAVDTKAFADSSPDAQVNTLVAALQRVPDSAQRAALGTQILGGEWMQLAPIVGLGAEALRNAKQAGEEYAMNEDQLTAANNFRIKMSQLTVVPSVDHKITLLVFSSYSSKNSFKNVAYLL